MAQQETKTSVLSASGQVTLYPGKIYSITVEGAAAANTVELRDNSTAGTGGTIIWTGDFTLTAIDTRHYSFPEGMSFTTNCYANIANATKISCTYKDNA